MASDFQQLDLTRFHTPVVRHLAWLCQAPQLLTGPIRFDPCDHLAAASLEKLMQWDLNPSSGPRLLSGIPHYRLGLYVESLYEYLLTELLGWQVLARNLPIRASGTTLGELDFVVRNPDTRGAEHHEIAVKFYLGYQSSPENQRWYGPNTRDRLDLKTDKLLNQQSPRSELSEARAVLNEMGIAESVTRRIFMPGYLFYPVDKEFMAPATVAHNHLRGRWTYLQKAATMGTECWVPLRKPHWLGPWLQADAPNTSDTHQAMVDIETTDTPRLFATMEYCEEKRLWQEADRIFVVPTTWPGTWPGV